MSPALTRWFKYIQLHKQHDVEKQTWRVHTNTLISINSVRGPKKAQGVHSNGDGVAMIAIMRDRPSCSPNGSTVFAHCLTKLPSLSLIMQSFRLARVRSGAFPTSVARRRLFVNRSPTETCFNIFYESRLRYVCYCFRIGPNTCPPACQAFTTHYFVVLSISDKKKSH